LTKLQANNINHKPLAEALNGTATKRGTFTLFKNKSHIMYEIKTGSILSQNLMISI